MKKIGQLTTKVGSGVTPKGGENVYTTEGHPFVRSQNVGNGHMLLKDIAFIDENTHKKQIATEIQKGDVLLNITGASIGRSSVAFDEVVGGNVNQHVCIVRPNKEILPYYLCYLFLSDKGQKQIDSFQAGGNRQGLNFEQIKSFKFSIPTIAEQEKVSDLLFLMDERIEAQSRAIEKLQSLMVEIAKSLTGHSPNTKISDCLVCHNSVLQESQVAELGTYPVYGANGVCGYTDTPLINEDSILIVKDGSGVGKVSFATGKFSVVGTSNYLTAKEGYSLRYLYYCLMCFNFTSYKTGMAIPHIYFKDYGKASIYCPSFEEQERIANALFKIETKIGIEQSLLEQFSLQKQFLLQEMFI